MSWGDFTLVPMIEEINHVIEFHLNSKLMSINMKTKIVVFNHKGDMIMNHYEWSNERFQRSLNRHNYVIYQNG